MSGIGLGIGLHFAKSSVFTPPAILGDGNTVMWNDPAVDQFVKDGSNLISQWTDKSGNNNHLLQSTPADQPLWSTDGVLLNGVNEYLKTAVFTLIQPEFIYMVLKQITWTSNDKIFDGNVTNTGAVQQYISSPNLMGRAGILSDVNGNLPLDTWGILRVLFNGVSSKLIVNETTPVTWDCGTSDMGGFTLGRSGTSVIAFGHLQAKEIIVRKIADTASNEQAIYNYLASKYSI